MPRPLRRRCFRLLALLLVVATSACNGASATHDRIALALADSGIVIPPPSQGFTPVQVVIGNPLDGRLAEVRDWVASSALLPRLARLVDSTVALRSPISVEAQECGVVNAAYDKGANGLPRIFLCYEMILAVFRAISAEGWEELEQLRAPADATPAWRTLQGPVRSATERRVIAVLVNIILHELSHAIEDRFALSLGVEAEFNADALGFHVGWHLMGLGTDFYLDVLEAFALAPGDWLQYEVGVGDLHPSRIERTWRLACRLAGVDPSTVRTHLDRLGEPRLTAAYCAEFAARDARYYRGALGPLYASQRRAITTTVASTIVETGTGGTSAPSGDVPSGGHR